MNTTTTVTNPEPNAEALRKSCSCMSCQRACHHTPGWFTPDQIATAAAYYGLTEREFFHGYCALRAMFKKEDAISDGPFDKAKAVWVVVPAIVTGKLGHEFPFSPIGTCRQLAPDGKCRIHAVKPFECAFHWHGITNEESGNKHQEILALWDTPESQDYCAFLLGREPVLNDPTPDELMAAMLQQIPQPLRSLFEMLGEVAKEAMDEMRQDPSLIPDDMREDFERLEQKRKALQARGIAV